MPLKQRVDRLLLVAVLLHATIGLALVATSSWLLAGLRYGRSSSYFFTAQAVASGVGMVLLVVVMNLDIVDLVLRRSFAWGGLGAACGLQIAAFFQTEIANTHRWLSLPGLSLQPSVLIRLALIAVIAVEITRARKLGWPPRQLLVLGAVVATALALVGGAPDLGSAAVIACVVGTLAFLAGIPLRWVAVPAVVAGIILGVAVRVSPYAWERVTAFADPSSTSPAAWQTRQSVLAIGSGGLTGRGLGQGLQKLGFLPEPHTDFVFSIAAEEAGLAGAAVLLLLIATITWRGLEISRRLRRLDYSLLAAGLTLAFTVQSLLHIAVCLGLAPTKGIPLPLISYGKTDALISLASMGLLLNLSREAW